MLFANHCTTARRANSRAALQRGVGDVLIANGRSVRFDAMAGAGAVQAGCTQVVR